MKLQKKQHALDYEKKLLVHGETVREDNLSGTQVSMKRQLKIQLNALYQQIAITFKVTPKTGSIAKKI